MRTVSTRGRREVVISHGRKESTCALSSKAGGVLLSNRYSCYCYSRRPLVHHHVDVTVLPHLSDDASSCLPIPSPQVVSPPEVSFQKDCSPAELRSLMRSTMDGTDKKLEAMVARVRKHLGGGSIFNKVWYTIKEQLIAR